jgi:methylmalonyl-CoA/ethylmalonyl-CoA epimerase
MPTIRTAEPADAGEVFTVQRAAFVAEAQRHDNPHLPPLTQTLDEVREDIDTQTVLVAHEGSRIVGTVRGVPIGPAWYIGRLAVAPDLQGHGIGRALLGAIERAAPAGTSEFTLTTGPKSTDTVRFYERQGYRTVPAPDDLIHLTKARNPMSLFTRIDHVGIAVPDLDAAIAFYRDTFGVTSVHEEVNEEQGVREAMLAVGDGTTQIQLLAPLTESSTIAKFIGRNGPGVQQVAYTVEDVEAVSADLRAKGLRLLYEAPRRGTADSRVNFIHPKDAGGVLVELVQRAPGSH